MNIKVRVLRTLKHSSFTSLLSYLVPELNPYHDDKLNPHASGVLHMELILHNSETSVEYGEFHLQTCFKTVQMIFFSVIFRLYQGKLDYDRRNTIFVRSSICFISSLLFYDLLKQFLQQPFHR